MDMQMYLLRFERLEEALSKKQDGFFVEAFRRASRNIISHALNNGYTHVSIKWLVASILSLLSRAMFGPDIPQEERVTEYIPETDDDTVDLEQLCATLKVSGPNIPSDHLFWFLCTGGKQGTRPDQAPVGRGQPSPSTSTRPPPQGSALSRPSDWADEVDEQFPLPPTGQAPNLGGGPAIPSAPKTSEEFIWDTYSSNFGSVVSFTYPLPRCIIYNDHIGPVAAQLSVLLGVKIDRTFVPHAVTIYLADDMVSAVLNAPGRKLVAYENLYRAHSYFSQWFDTMHTTKQIPPLSRFIHDLRTSATRQQIETCHKIAGPVATRIRSPDYYHSFVATVTEHLDANDPYVSKNGSKSDAEVDAEGEARPEPAAKRRKMSIERS